MSTFLLVAFTAILGVVTVQKYNRGPGLLALIAGLIVRALAAGYWLREAAAAVSNVRCRWYECLDRARRMVP